MKNVLSLRSSLLPRLSDFSLTGFVRPERVLRVVVTAADCAEDVDAAAVVAAAVALVVCSAVAGGIMTDFDVLGMEADDAISSLAAR